MKKLFSFLIIPIFAIIFFYGCGEDKTIEDVKKLYETFVSVTPVEELEEGEDPENLFFSDNTKTHTITIKYPEILTDSINNETPSSDMLFRYRALFYSQQILTNIFNFYENNQEDFYKVLASSNVNYKADLNNLYTKLSDLKATLEGFKSDYTVFIDSFAGSSMRFNVTNYTYKLNCVIEKSFDFINLFEDMYYRYCVEDISVNSVKNLQLLIDSAYLDVATVVYYENFKSFNYSVIDNGECDLAPLFSTTANEYRLIDLLQGNKTLSITIQNGLDIESATHNDVLNLINNFRYAKDVFTQRWSTYNNIYNEIDFYTLNQYRCGLVGDVNYESYLNTLTVSNRSLIEMTEDYIDVTFNDYVTKLNTITI